MGAEDLHHRHDDQAGGEVAGQSGDQGTPFLVLLLFKLHQEKMVRVVIIKRCFMNDKC